MTLPRPVQAVVFDMDGLLIDSEAVYREALEATAAQRNLDLPASVTRQMIGLIWPESSRVLIEHFGPGFDAEEFRQAVIHNFYGIERAEVALKDGVVEILETLERLGLPCAIATSSPRGSVEHHIGGHGLLERFQAIVAAGECARSKPAPDPFLKAAQLLGVDPRDCLALEDSHNGVRAASSAGMMTIMVPDLLDDNAEMHSLCIRIVRDLHEVAQLLDRQTA